MAALRKVLFVGLLSIFVFGMPAGAQEGPAYVDVPPPRLNPVDTGPALAVTAGGGSSHHSSHHVAGAGLQPGVLGARGELGSTGFAVTGGDVLGLLGIATMAMVVGIGLLRAARPKSPAEPA